MGTSGRSGADDGDRNERTKGQLRQSIQNQTKLLGLMHQHKGYTPIKS
jgi:hypothetical protein